MLGWEEAVLKIWGMVKNWMSWVFNVLWSVSVNLNKYSPGHRSKKNMNQARLMVVLWWGDP